MAKRLSMWLYDGADYIRRRYPVLGQLCNEFDLDNLEPRFPLSTTYAQLCGILDAKMVSVVLPCRR
jgi:hypothetical protein